MTNGQLTKQILQAAKTMSGDNLLRTVTMHMRRFPLSSEKLVYDQDKKKVSPEAWKIIIQAAIATDTIKGDDCNRMNREIGCPIDKTYGRAKGLK